MLESQPSECIMFVQKPLDQFCDLHVRDIIMAAQLAGVTTVAHVHLMTKEDLNMALKEQTLMILTLGTKPTPEQRLLGGLELSTEVMDQSFVESLAHLITFVPPAKAAGPCALPYRTNALLADLNLPSRIHENGTSPIHFHDFPMNIFIFWGMSNFHV